jgi:hypothetical protein
MISFIFILGLLHVGCRHVGVASVTSGSRRSRRSRPRRGRAGRDATAAHMYYGDVTSEENPFKIGLWGWINPSILNNRS